MLRNILAFFVVVFLFSACTKEIEQDGEWSNKDKMNMLDIPDPMVWNSLVTQSIELDTTGGVLKSGNSLHEYPSNGYYFALFEDLYPSQGDYDFNDVILRSKLFIEWANGGINGYFSTKVINDGGSLDKRIGLMFYTLSNDVYTRIDNADISINGSPLEGSDPFLMDFPAQGELFEIDYVANNASNIWITWFIEVTSDGVAKEIHTSGFPQSDIHSFTLPQPDYLTLDNLPWGLEIEAEDFAVPQERILFLDAYPFFAEWAESGGSAQKDWYTKPDLNYVK